MNLSDDLFEILAGILNPNQDDEHEYDDEINY
jgi:hypothetical protein